MSGNVLVLFSSGFSVVAAQRPLKMLLNVTWKADKSEKEKEKNRKKLERRT